MSIDLSLHRIRVLNALFPPYTRPTCHIAGTNGKGSVSALLSSVLRATEPPLSVGRFNSPHLVSVCDSIVIDGHPVDYALYSSVRTEVESTDRTHSIGATSFELLTTTALLIFERARVDIVVLEVGMGGRLDATNVIPDESVLVSALTAVDLDHQAFLGNTVAEIAAEKAGIARPDTMFVVGRQPHPDVALVVEDLVGLNTVHAQSVRRVADQSQDARQGQDVEFSLPALGSSPIRARLPLLGDHQLDNLGVVVSILDVLLAHPYSIRMRLRQQMTSATIVRGIESTTWPGRLSFHTMTTDSGHRRLILADGAHNPASSATLAAFIRQWHSRHSDASIAYILALSHSPPKTPLETLSPLFSADNPSPTPIRVAVLRFTPPDGMPWVKSVPPSSLRTVVAQLAPGAEVWAPSDEDAVQDQLHQALTWTVDVSREDSLTVLAGSLYLVADLYRFLATTEQV